MEILIRKGLYQSKTAKHSSNAYFQLSMISSPKSLSTRELCSLKVELELLLMNFFKKTPFPLSLVDILICEGLFFPKTSKHRSNTYRQLSMASYPKLLRPR